MKPIIFGPGSIEQAHKENEFIEYSQIKNYSKVLEKLIRQTCC